jgi:hypothetical protein
MRGSVTPDTETYSLEVGAGKKLRAYGRALDDRDRDSLVPLIRLLHATLDADEMLARLRQGSRLEDFAQLRPVERLRLLSFAERWGADARDIERMADSFAPTDMRLRGVRKRLAARAPLAAGPLGDIALFSIGANCLGWTLCNRWGLRRSEDIADLFTPLSLAVHRPAFVVRMIKSGFEDYLDTGALRSIVTTAGHQAVARADGGALWNHCVGPFWSHGGFRKFERIMGRRLDRFLAQAFADSATFRVFIFNLTNAPSRDAARDHVVAIADALAGRVKGPHGVIGLDSNRHTAGVLGRLDVAPRVALIWAPPPSVHYTWSKDYNSADGMDYEFAIISALEACVGDWVARDRRRPSAMREANPC